MTRLQQLRNRRERLIELNAINNYTQSEHPKIDKYYKLLLATKKEINDIECVNVHPIRSRMIFTTKDLYQLKNKQP